MVIVAAAVILSIFGYIGGRSMISKRRCNDNSQKSKRSQLMSIEGEKNVLRLDNRIDGKRSIGECERIHEKIETSFGYIRDEIASVKIGIEKVEKGVKEDMQDLRKNIIGDIKIMLQNMPK